MLWYKVYPALARWVENCNAFTISDAQSYKNIFLGYHWHIAILGDPANGVVGTAVDRNSNVSKFKAISEMFEREITYSQNLATTNGCALSFSKSDARRASTMELYERDRFYLHYLNSMPFISTPSLRKISMTGSALRIKLELEKLGIELEFREMLPIKGMRFVIAAVFGENYKRNQFGTVIALGTATTLSGALEKSLCSILMRAAEILKDPDNFRTQKITAKLSRVDYHHYAGLSISYGRWWKSKYFKFFSTIESQHLPPGPSPTIETIQYCIRCKNKKLTVFWSHAQSKRVQVAVFGKRQTSSLLKKGVDLNKSAEIKFISDYRKSFPNTHFTARRASKPHPLA